MLFRTDIAEEIRDEKMKGYSKDHKGEIDGIAYKQKAVDGIRVTEIKVISPKGERAIGKPMGTYITVDTSGIWRHSDKGFAACTEVIARKLSDLIPCADTVLAVGLGNLQITADALGPRTAEKIIATRHIKDKTPLLFSSLGLGNVAVLTPGVLAQTGIDAMAQIKAACREVKPSVVILVDSLASRSTDALNKTVQITDTGISPGSGVGNDRGEISEKTLGVPTVALGVPTIVDAATIIASAFEDARIPAAAAAAMERCKGCYVCAKDQDRAVSELGRLIGFALNRFCHRELSLSEMAYI